MFGNNPATFLLLEYEQAVEDTKDYFLVEQEKMHY